MGNRRRESKESKTAQTKQPTVEPEEAEAKEGAPGVTEWLASEKGVGWMQFFVITNSLILLLTTALPRIWESIDFLISGKY